MYRQWLAFARATLGRADDAAERTCSLSDLHALSAAVHDLQARAASSHTRLFLSQSHAMVERYEHLSAGQIAPLQVRLSVSRLGRPEQHSA